MKKVTVPFFEQLRCVQKIQAPSPDIQMTSGLFYSKSMYQETCGKLFCGHEINGERPQQTGIFFRYHFSRICCTHLPAEGEERASTICKTLLKGFTSVGTRFYYLQNTFWFGRVLLLPVMVFTSVGTRFYYSQNGFLIVYATLSTSSITYSSAGADSPPQAKNLNNSRPKRSKKHCF